MALPNIFKKDVTDKIIQRINSLTPNVQPNWGKMSVDQMLAHCNVTYLLTYEQEKFKKPNAFMKFILKTFIKKVVVSEKQYVKNSRTAPEFIISEAKNFEKEKGILIENILKTQALGESYFDGLENFSFGKMTAIEWNNLFYKHLEHHLNQFGV